MECNILLSRVSMSNCVSFHVVLSLSPGFHWSRMQLQMHDDRDYHTIILSTIPTSTRCTSKLLYKNKCRIVNVNRSDMHNLRLAGHWRNIILNYHGSRWGALRCTRQIYPYSHTKWYSTKTYYYFSFSCSVAHLEL